MEELIPEVEEYLRNHNTERFGFCPTFNNGRPIKEELRDLYIDNIDTYKKVVKFARDLIIDDSEYETLVERGQHIVESSTYIRVIENEEGNVNENESEEESESE